MAGFIETKYYGHMYRLAAIHSHPIQYFAPFYRRLAQETEIDLTVYYCSRQGLDDYEDSEFGQRLRWDMPLLEGYRSVFLPNLLGRKQVGGFLSLINISIIEELRHHRYDALLVHGHGYLAYVLAIGAAKVLGTPVLMRNDTHLLLKRSPAKLALRRLVMSQFYRLCAACLPIGTRNQAFYRYHGVSEARLFLVPFTVDNAYFINAAEPYLRDSAGNRAQLGLPTTKPLILFASKLIPRKRSMDLLQAYHHLRNQNIEAALIFAGSGSDQEQLKAYVANNCLPDVYFLGFMNQSELPRVFAAADIFVLPSEDEPWGLVINEVMCSGLPIVASKEIGAVPDLVIDGFNGLTYEAGDIHQLASHLETLVTDINLCQELGKNSLKLISQWNYDLCAKGMLAALHSLARASQD